MERLQNINANRIAWCCADYGMSPVDLAIEVGISRATMARLMNGGGGLTFKQLARIAAFFGRGVLFFLQPGEVEPDAVHTSVFRTLFDRKPALSANVRTFIERVEHQRAIYAELREDLANDELPRFQPPDLPKDSPVDAARLVRAWLAIPERKSFDTCRAAIEAKGVLVFLSNGFQGKWQIAEESPVVGLTLYDTACPVIVIKKQRCELQQTFTLIHELGHLLMHRISSIDEEADLYSHEGDEQLANVFAGHVLVPDALLQAIDPAQRPPRVVHFDAWLESSGKQWGVSTEVILRRLLDTGRLPRAEYEQYRAWHASVVEQARDRAPRLQRHREPKHIFGDTFVRAVLDAMHSKYISLSKASTYLDGLKITDLHKLDRYYAGL
ncbi:MAG: XRE family transcriptional regulator [Massilia sp.]